MVLGKDTSIPEQKTVGLIVLARISHDGENPWRILLLRSNTEQLRLSGSTWDVPKGRMGKKSLAVCGSFLCFFRWIQN